MTSEEYSILSTHKIIRCHFKHKPTDVYKAQFHKLTCIRLLKVIKSILNTEIFLLILNEIFGTVL